MAAEAHASMSLVASVVRHVFCALLSFRVTVFPFISFPLIYFLLFLSHLSLFQLFSLFPFSSLWHVFRALRFLVSLCRRICVGFARSERCTARVKCLAIFGYSLVEKCMARVPCPASLD